MKLLSLLFTATAMVVPAATAMASPDASTESSADQISVQTTGNVTFDLDSDQIFDLHGTGTLFVSDKSHTTTKTLQAQGSSVVYAVNGVAKPYDAAAKDWLRGVLASQPPPPPPPPAP
ncbi:MAG TPA: hypothetical protein VH165_21565 [Kofleriaceae bacterium]|jgi:hypothetical protein|nr:hypothetical protein [Kofleriaceae bacterium]